MQLLRGVAVARSRSLCSQLAGVGASYGNSGRRSLYSGRDADLGRATYVRARARNELLHITFRSNNIR